MGTKPIIKYSMTAITLYAHGDGDVAGTMIDFDRGIDRARSDDTCSAGVIAARYGLTLLNEAEPGFSNSFVIRTAKDTLELKDPRSTIVLIGWCSLNRDEVLVDGVYHQFNGGSWYVPPPNAASMHRRWREQYVDDPKGAEKLCQKQQEMIMDFHVWLSRRGFPHRFFHCFSSFPNDSSHFGQMTWPKDTWIDDCAYDGLRSMRNVLHEAGKIDRGVLDDIGNAYYADHIDHHIRAMLSVLGHSAVPRQH
jgi:hypothetical protein